VAFLTLSTDQSIRAQSYKHVSCVVQARTEVLFYLLLRNDGKLFEKRLSYAFVPVLLFHIEVLKLGETP